MSQFLNLFRSKKVEMAFLPVVVKPTPRPSVKRASPITLAVFSSGVAPSFSESKVVGLEKIVKKKVAVVDGPASEIQVLASRLGGDQLAAAQFLIQEVYFLSRASGGLVQMAIEDASLPSLMEIVGRLSGEDLAMATDIARFILDGEIIEILVVDQLLREKRERLLASV